MWTFIFNMFLLFIHQCPLLMFCNLKRVRNNYIMYSCEIHLKRKEERESSFAVHMYLCNIQYVRKENVCSIRRDKMIVGTLQRLSNNLLH